ncbi:hypothetical protein [Streptomyces sp. NPDC048106]|uniref:hypothetical protein n=1 Tax=Streptomyces sp. NPDC048106 TaxID=3155750 RepID=UPI003455C8AD
MQAAGPSGPAGASLFMSIVTHHHGGHMALHRLGKDPGRLAQLDVPDHGTVIEFPRRMTPFFPEVNSLVRDRV